MAGLTTVVVVVLVLSAAVVVVSVVVVLSVVAAFTFVCLARRCWFIKLNNAAGTQKLSVRKGFIRIPVRTHQYTTHTHRHALAHTHADSVRHAHTFGRT